MADLSKVHVCMGNIFLLHKNQFLKQINYVQGSQSFFVVFSKSPKWTEAVLELSSSNRLWINIWVRKCVDIQFFVSSGENRARPFWP